MTGYQPFEDIKRILPEDFTSRDTLSRAQFFEMDLFLANYLLSSQGDRVAMAHSLEIRLPYLDHRVVEFAARLPSKWKINGLNEKYMLKHSFGGLIPKSIRNRSKQPYRAPIREVFFGDHVDDSINEMLSESALKRAGIFNPERFGHLVAKYRQADTKIDSEVQNMAVVGILSTQLIYDQFIENFPWKVVEPIIPDKIIKKKVD